MRSWTRYARSCAPRASTTSLSWARADSSDREPPIFAEHGINVAAIFDIDPEKIGESIGDLRISSNDEMAEVCRERNIIVGVIAVPADTAQDAADALIHSGTKIIFNYSEALLDVPSDVNVHTSNPRWTCSTPCTSTPT